MLGEVAGISNVSTRIDAVYFFAILLLRHCQEFFRAECFNQINIVFLVGVFRQIDNHDAVRTVAAVGVVQEYRLAGLVFARER